MTFDDFVKKYEGKTVGFPNNNSFYGECLSLTKWHIEEVYGIYPPASGCNGARCYWSMFPYPLETVLKKVPNTPDLIPERGWIVVWNEKTGGGAGHIASILSADKNSFISLDQNWGGKHAHRVTHDYSNVYGFLAPLEGFEGSNMNELEVCLAQHKELVTKLDNQDKIIAEITADKDRYKSERDQARIERDNYAEENKGLNTQIEILKKDISSLNSELGECQAEVSEAPSLEDYTTGFTPTGRKIIEVQGDKTIETSYAVKEN